MNTEKILKIEIDKEKRLLITPESSKFPMIYRAANGINWNSEKKSLISSIPREWDYEKWFYYIIDFLASDYNLKLKITDDTIWNNIPSQIKEIIMNSEKTKPNNA